MPRLCHSVPKYRKHKATGQAIVTIAGKDYYLGPHGTRASKCEYDRRIMEWMAAGRPDALTPENDQITVEEILGRFVLYAQKYYRKHGRPTGTAENFYPVIQLVKNFYAETLACQFGPLSLKALMGHMVMLGHSRRYVNDNAQRIKRIFRWAVSEQLISVSVSQALATVSCLPEGRTEARESEPIEPVDSATVEATLPHLPKVVADMVRLQRLTGMRPGEVCQLRSCDIDRSARTWKFTPQSHKTEHHGRKRVIFIGPQARMILASYLSWDSTAYCFSPKESEFKRLEEAHARRKVPLSCGNKPGSNRTGIRGKQLRNQYTNDSYRRAIERGCEVAFKMPHSLRYLKKTATAEKKREAREWRRAHCWSPNRLRHSMATDVRNQFGLEAAQVLLGHSRADVTQIYTKRNLELAEQVASQIG